MKTLELFSGYGTATFALKRLGIDHEVVGYSDIDKYANQCFAQNHGGKELGDATKIDPNDLEDFDLLTGGFPCQAFSVAGKGLGELDTRGTLFNEIIRIAESKQPKYMLLENVKGLLSKRHIGTYQKILGELHRIGYKVYTKVLNTKDYGIPQNRERVFFVCFRYKDFRLVPSFKFPRKEELKIFLKDILEDRVDDKYYLKQKQIDKILSKGFKIPETSYCIDANYYKGTNLKGYIEKRRRQLVCSQPLRFLDRNQKELPSNYAMCVDASNTNGVRILQRPHGANKGGERAIDGVVPAITSNAFWEHNNYLKNGLVIRKLTPKECFRLQGFLGDEVNLDGLSDTQQYKLAGNGQSVNVVAKIFEQMFGLAKMDTKNGCGCRFAKNPKYPDHICDCGGKLGHICPECSQKGTKTSVEEKDGKV